jgi:hypothetical protein
MANGYGLDGRGQIPERANIPLVPILVRWALTLTQTPHQCSLGIRRLESEADQPPPYNTMS